MLEVTIILHSAVTGKASRLGFATIANDGTGTRGRGNYNVTFYGKRRVIRRARVTNFRRLGLNAWDLLREAMKEENTAK